eukprot:CAMPEP_0182914460 /NCGR_PEP_ID=MMETSP0034_2-20130328/38585_1 /TAXON_ID=156128 /ORGANISM="Nephroselmis pyriformis, Strain CCMP717" /LENGTH=212 /DNA_ID=CAMNT_0025051241 /DNA_START=203 /DNA_END=839 /DNA_ORIENTATION=+
MAGRVPLRAVACYGAIIIETCCTSCDGTPWRKLRRAKRSPLPVRPPALGPSALPTPVPGGLAYLTSTAGATMAGRVPLRAVACYGAYTQPLPACNEQGLRVLIGAAVREGAMRGIQVRPVFSYFSPHGPVFRVMVEGVRRQGHGGAASVPPDGLGYIAHCKPCGEYSTVGLGDLGGEAAGPCCLCGGPRAVSGPLWTRALHDRGWLKEMRAA